MQATASASPRTLTELDLNELYGIRVRAYTSAGSGPYSDEIRIMTREDGECMADGKAIALNNLPSPERITIALAVAINLALAVFIRRNHSN